MGTTGNVDFLFNRVCFFNIKNTGIDPEELELELIDFGAEDIEVDEDQIIITAGFRESFWTAAKTAQENMDFEIIESGFDRVPTTTTELNERANNR